MEVVFERDISNRLATSLIALKEGKIAYFYKEFEKLY